MAETPPAQSSTLEARVTSFHEFQSPHEASVDRLVLALDKAYHRPWLMMWRSLLQGFMFTVGASVGSIVVFGLSVYFFQRSGGIDLLKPFFNSVSDQLSNSVQKSLNPTGNVPALLGGVNNNESNPAH